MGNSGAKSIHKGRKAEQEAGRILSKWWGENFRRTGLGMPGADFLEPPSFPCKVEVKNVKDIKFKHLLFTSKKLRGFQDKITAQADDGDKLPMLVMLVEGKWMASFKGEAVRKEYFFAHQRPLCHSNNGWVALSLHGLTAWDNNDFLAALNS